MKDKEAKRKLKRCDDGDDDDELFVVKGKGKKRKKRCSSSSSEDEQTMLTKKIDIINAKVSQVLDVNAHLPLPLGLSSRLYEAFKCTICLISPILPLSSLVNAVVA